METNIATIIVIVLLSLAFIIYLVRRNIKDEENTDPKLTDAFKNRANKEVNDENVNET
jgi:hypothetical protein